MKLIGWIGKMIITAMVVAAISAATTLYVMNVYVEEMLKPYGAAIPSKRMDFAEFVANLWNGSNIVSQGGTAQQGKERMPQPDAGKVALPEDDAVAAWSQFGAGEAGAKEKVVISAEQFQATREKLSEEDKVTVFTMLISQLPEEELQHISTKLEDGLTAAELKEIEEIIGQYLLPEQMDKLMEIVNKY